MRVTLKTSPELQSPAMVRLAGAGMIKVTKEPSIFRKCPMENCFKCGNKTDYWYVPKDVACCQSCASEVKVKDVPSKAEWMKRERAKLPANSCI
jgi:hypothetical protein